MRQLDYHFPDDYALSQALMPHIDEMGLFFQIDEEFNLGDMLQFTVTMPTSEQLILQGEVVWITPDTNKVMWFTPETTSGEYSRQGIGLRLIGANAELLRTYCQEHKQQVF